jgi:hypothetical protein
MVTLIWYLVAVLPTFMLLDGSEKFGKFLKRNNIYDYWDVWHSIVVLLIVFLAVLYYKGVY